MKTLLEDYERRLKTVLSELKKCELNIEKETRLATKASCYKTFIIELTKQLTLTDVVNCNCDESKQLEEEFEINHLINDTYQVVGKDSSTVWKQGTMEECNDWVML